MKWKMEIRSSQFYDSSNPRDWSFDASIPDGQELRPDFIQSMWDDLQNEVFCGTKTNEYLSTGTTPDIVAGQIDTKDESPCESVRELIVYSSARTEPQLIQVGKYYGKLTGYNHG